MLLLFPISENDIAAFMTIVLNQATGKNAEHRYDDSLSN
jgi:hypothetical protein